MRDTTGHNRDGSPEDPESSPNRPTVSHTPQQRRLYLKGLRAWARVAVRSFIERRGFPADECHPDQDGTGERGCKPKPEHGDCHERD